MFSEYPYNEYPYTDFHEMNLDWVLSKMKEMSASIDDIPNIIDKLLNDIGIQQFISSYLNELREQIADANEELNTASASRSVGELVFVQGKLYRVTKEMTAGDRYVDGGNCVKTTVEDLIYLILTSVTNLIESNSKIASADRAVNDFVWLNGKLVKIIAPIKKGATYDVNNYVAFNVNDFYKEYSININKIPVLEQNISDFETRINNKVDELENEISTKVGTFKSLKGKQIAIYGDSYADPSNVFIEWVNILSEYSGRTVHNNSVNGRTLSDINDAFDNYKADVYIIEGGVNDWNENVLPITITSVITSIVNKCKAVSPNCDIIFTTPLYGLHQQPNYPNVKSVLPLELVRQSIWSGCIQNNVMVCSGLRMENVIVGDGLHPTVESVKYIAYSLITSYENGGDSRDFITDWGWLSADNLSYIMMRDGMPYLTLKGIPVAFANGLGHIDYNMFKTGNTLSASNQIGFNTLGADAFVYKCGFDSTGISISCFKASTGLSSDVNGTLNVAISDMFIDFIGLVNSGSTTNP